jgi:hypothetical protein
MRRSTFGVATRRLPVLDDLSAGDDLLRWASEAEAGSWDKLRDTAAYLIAIREARRRPWQMVSRLSALGHLDIDWDAGRWSVARPCLALSPGMGMCAFAAGWRAGSWLRQVETISEPGYMTVHPVAQGTAPHAVFFKADDIDGLRSAAESTNARFVIDPAAQLAELVEVTQISETTLASAPIVDEELQYFDADTISWVPTQSRDEEGLYSFDLHGRRDFRLHVDSDWHKVDRATGQLHELQGRDDVAIWHPQSRDYMTARALVLPFDVSLPAVAERAAVASSGLLPVIQRGKKIYRNVARSTAVRICEKVGLGLGFDSMPAKITNNGVK